jgi:hypothetical protein
MRMFKRQPRPTRKLTSNCPIREHTADGAYVGRCDFALYDDICPRHGFVSDYPNLDDRDVEVGDRRPSDRERR